MVMCDCVSGEMVMCGWRDMVIGAVQQELISHYQ